MKINGGSNAKSGGRNSAKDFARRTAIEKNMAAYIPLECGHFQTRETFMHYGRIIRKRGRAYCEKCNEMTTVKKADKKPPLPEEPLF